MHIKILDKINKHNVEFKKYFGTDLKVFVNPLLARMGIFDFDIISFDKYLHRQGYREEKHGSIKDYLLTKHGKDAVDLIDDLILMDIGDANGGD